MAKPTLGDISSAVLDPMLSDNFVLEIPSVPTGAVTTPLRLQCVSANKPGTTINPIEVQLFGHTLEYAGQKTFGHDLNVDYVENRDAVITKLLEDWAELIRGTESQHGAFKGPQNSGYARDAYLKIFDQKGTLVREYTIFSIWPATVPDIPFTGASVDKITLSVVFKYDHYLPRSGGSNTP